MRTKGLEAVKQYATRKVFAELKQNMPEYSPDRIKIVKARISDLEQALTVPRFAYAASKIEGWKAYTLHVFTSTATRNASGLEPVKCSDNRNFYKLQYHV